MRPINTCLSAWTVAPVVYHPASTLYAITIAVRILLSSLVASAARPTFPDFFNLTCITA
ncbi:uncharacterized protein PAS_chr4_0975 [Komagataella phaffii GS115]|uniref:Uncharacterized protein n=1 Tax=Komagataella phaffii (strain GS115 / ATCC 20864) TaxID=644223 RepID=C4R863_KOMPG|nr:uncharacterized protein PAS_chr4_0975 [Komagataella phaffii GS115]CAY71788.1 hypothetical protein PAS_chr4_0975 [Komagataella phaffii GS115]